MIVEDFVLKMIRKGVEFIAKALKLSKEGEFLQSEAVIDNGLYELTGLSIESLNNMPMESVDILLGNNPGKIIVAAEFIKAYGEIKREKGEIEAYKDSLDKSLKLLMLVNHLNIDEVAREINNIHKEISEN